MSPAAGRCVRGQPDQPGHLGDRRSRPPRPAAPAPPSVPSVPRPRAARRTRRRGTTRPAAPAAGGTHTACSGELVEAVQDLAQVGQVVVGRARAPTRPRAAVAQARPARPAATAPRVVTKPIQARFAAGAQECKAGRMTVAVEDRTPAQAPARREIGVTELILRDAHQSLMATRMALEDMVDACADIDAAGYWSVECWGGATYDACIRFLNEDPWERLRTFRELMPNSRLQMLLRGQNLLGYRHYEDGVVDRFVEKSAENGMDVYRVFDALNDVRNVRHAIAAVRRVDKHAQGTICYTESPLHTVQGYVADGPGPDGSGLRLPVPQGHGGAAQAAAGLRHRQGHQGRPGPGRPDPRALPRDHRRHPGQPDEGDRGRRRRRRHRHLLDLPGPRAQPHRVAGRDARRHAVHHQPRRRPAAPDQGPLRHRCGRATPSSCRPSPASRPRSSRARSPAG